MNYRYPNNFYLGRKRRIIFATILQIHYLSRPIPVNTVSIKKHPYQALRRISALLMLLSLCMVLLIKVFHVHGHSGFQALLKDPARAAIAAAHYCAVCDYHLSKDAEVTPVLPVSVYVVAIVLAPIVYHYSFSAFQRKLQSRGPPSYLYA